MAAIVTHVDTKIATTQNTQDEIQEPALLDTFWRLAEPNDDERLKGASVLLEILIKKQKQHRKSGSANLCCSEVEYSLQRLIKGLASARKGSRLGYVTVLAELLEKCPRISLDGILTLVQEQLAVKGKKEERHFIFGQVFAYLAIIQSGRLKRSDEKFTVEVIQSLYALGERKSYLQEICFQAIVDVISKVKFLNRLHMGENVVHLAKAEIDTLILKQFAAYLQTTENVFIDHLWPKLKPKLKMGWDDCTAVTLAMLIVCRKQFPDVVKSKFVQTHYGHSNLLDVSNLHHIARILVKSTIIAHPNVHFACDIIFAEAMQDRAKLPVFWHKVVVEGLCSARQECKFLALKLVQRILPMCDAKLVKVVFSETLIRVFINSLSNKQGFLHKAALQFSADLPGIVGKMTDAKAQVTIIQCLLSSEEQIFDKETSPNAMRTSPVYVSHFKTTPGHIYFDDVTKSKTIYNLVSQLHADGVKLYLEWLKKLFVSGTGSIRLEPDWDSDRKWVCIQILSLLRNPCLPREDVWMQDACQFLFLHSFFRVTTPDPTIDGCHQVLSEPVSEALRRQIAPFAYSAVGAIANFSPGVAISVTENGASGSQVVRKALGSTSGGILWVHVFSRYVQQLLDSTGVKISGEFDAQAQEAWNKMYAAVEKIQKKRSKKSSMSSGLPFQLLFLHVGLQMLSEPKQSVDILEDLHGCYERALQRRKSAKKNEEEEPDWVVVVTEILLSLLSRSSHLLRTVVENVFKMVCPHLTKEALSLLLNVINPEAGADETNMEVADDSDEELEGEAGVTEEKEEEGSDDIDDDEEEDDEDDTKHSKKVKLQKSTSKKVEEEDSEDSDDDEEEEDGGAGEVDEVLRAKLKAALGDAAKQSDEDEAEESDAEYDDDKMIQIDSLLEEIFQQHKNSSMTRKQMDSAVLHFKLRVLDLIDIFLRRQQENPLVLDLVEPLLMVAKVAAGRKDNQILADRAFRIYRNKLCASKKYPHGISEQKEDVHQMLENLMQLAKRGHSVQMVSMASSGCLYLMKVLRGNAVVTGPSPLQTRRQRSEKRQLQSEQAQAGVLQTELLDEDRIAALYTNALEDFMTRKGTCLHPVLFSDLIERFPMISWRLVEPLIQYVTEGVQLYRKTQACHLLKMLLAKRPFLGDLKTWPKLSKHLLKRLLETLQTMQGDDVVIKPKFLVQVLELVVEFAKLSHHVEQEPNFSSVTSAIADLKKKSQVKKSKDVTTAMAAALAAIASRSNFSFKRKHGKKKKNRSARMREIKRQRKGDGPQ